MDFTAFYEALVLHGLEHFRKFYGWYRGTVTRNDDPEKRGRIQARVPQVGHQTTPDVWIDPAFDAAGEGRGAFFPPEVGDSVRVGFEHGRPDKPVIYVGGWFGAADVPSEFSYTAGQKVAGQTGTVSVPERRGFISRKGHRIVFNDEKGKESVELSWHQPSASDASVTADAAGDRSQTANRSTGKTATLKFDENGDITLTNASGSFIRLSAKSQNIVVQDQNNNVITIDKDGVVMDSTKTTKIVLKVGQVELADGADQQGVRGNELFQWLLSHTHGTAWGPSSPALTPPPQTILSRNVRLK